MFGNFLLVFIVMVFPALCVSALLLELMARVGAPRTWTGLAAVGVALAFAPLLGLLQGENAAFFALGIGAIAGVLQLRRGRSPALATWVMAALAGAALLGLASSAIQMMR